MERSDKRSYVRVDRAKKFDLVAVVLLLVFFFSDTPEGHSVFLEYDLFVLGIANLFLSIKTIASINSWSLD